VAKGGRVLTITALGATIAQARERAYLAIGKVGWPEGFCRTDIGWCALQRRLKTGICRIRATCKGYG
jgi:phosphoribosylamine--glycine ligase